MSAMDEIMADDVKWTRIILVEAERKALEAAALHRGRLDKLYRAEQQAAKNPGSIVNPRILRKWREETEL